MTFQINANFVCYKSRPIKNTNLYHYMGSFKLRMHQNPFSAGTLPQTQLGSLRRSPRPPSGWQRTPLPIPRPLDACSVSITRIHDENSAALLLGASSSFSALTCRTFSVYYIKVVMEK